MMKLYVIHYNKNGEDKLQKVLAIDKSRARQKFCQKMNSADAQYEIEDIVLIDTNIWC
mgnify:FL=1|jgi:hypothetical protein